ncbi:hypothetical protein IFM89_006468 [Coptis chinensis]|uniref:Uncharacterized protein n=1 Tax=Coptis chinensis TaxID=261450 RepID=A0A835IK60_9MAGN|nr:hypothetical protein IFM89_006468 [Coptis chinensis]
MMEQILPPLESLIGKYHIRLDHQRAPAMLEGKVAIIAGGASGIGESAVRLFWQNGAKAIVADIQDDLGQAICDQLDENAIYVHCDVSNEDEISNLVNAAVAKYGKLDIMYNNAGIIDGMPLHHIC